MTTSAERELNDRRDAVLSPQVGKPRGGIAWTQEIDALIAAAKRVGEEERDREWLAKAELREIGIGEEPREDRSSGRWVWWKVDPSRMGYEPDGSGGWRKIGGDDDR